MVMPFVYGKGHRNLLTKEQSDEQQVLLKEFGSYVIDQLEEKNPEDYEELEKVTTEAVNEFFDGNIKWGKVEGDDE